MAVAQRIKVTPGITGLSGPRVHIDGPVWHLKLGTTGRDAVKESAYNGETQTACVCVGDGSATKTLNASASDPVTTVANQPRWQFVPNGKFITVTTRRPLAFGRAGW